jgi:magnesium-transporting ATPase (P-type)
VAVLTGSDLAAMDDAQFVAAANATAVFARVEPEQKLRLVRALQQSGEVVAMTGDGVNDAPALKQADIGVAMGLGGTDVAREAAAMVLTDDNFASIEAAVEEGRGVYDNLVKFITWTLPTNFGEGLVILAAILAGAILPITPLQILWINMTTAVLLGLMLSFEPVEKGLMRRPPRPPAAPILDRPLIARIVLVSVLLLVGAYGLFLLELQQGHSLAEARTVAVNVFVVVEMFYLFNCRSLTRSFIAVGVFSNPWVWVGSGIMLALQLLLTYLPAMNRIFGTAPIGWAEWAAILLVGWGASLVVGIEKRFRLFQAAARPDDKITPTPSS